MPVAVPTDRGRPGLSADFRRLWWASTASEAGSAVAYGALPLVALLVLHASAWQVSLLAALSGIGAACVSLPLGPYVEFRRKRPVMVAADAVRAAALISLPLAGLLGVLTYTQLCVVGVVQTVATIAFQAASGAHLRDLVPDASLARAQAHLDTVRWTATSVGPPVGGALVSWLGATVTIALDAVSYVLSALGIARIQAPEPEPPTRAAQRHWWRESLVGWGVIRQTRGVHALFWNSLLFGGSVMWVSPLLAVFILRDLGLPAWAFGVAMGAAGLGGIIGAMLAPRLIDRWGLNRILLTFGVARNVWMVLLPLAPAGWAGWAVVTVAEFALLVSAGVFNPTFVTFRVRQVPRETLARVTASWSISQKVVQPLFIAVGGAVAAWADVRTALAVAAVLTLTSTALLPWHLSCAREG